MTNLSEKDTNKLLDEARMACQLTYSPYSNFVVGAAVLTKNGNIYKGSNIENASYGLTICAERIAVGHAFSNGETDIRAIAVWTYTESEMPCAPCGACRQFILEFGSDIVVIFRQGDTIVQKTIDELLPYGFTKKTME